MWIDPAKPDKMMVPMMTEEQRARLLRRLAEADEADEEPLPAALRQRLLDRAPAPRLAPVIDLAARRAAQPRPPSRLARLWLAHAPRLVAAAVVLVLVGGTFGVLRRWPSSPPLTFELAMHGEDQHLTTAAPSLMPWVSPDRVRLARLGRDKPFKLDLTVDAGGSPDVAARAYFWRDTNAGQGDWPYPRRDLSCTAGRCTLEATPAALALDAGRWQMAVVVTAAGHPLSDAEARAAIHMQLRSTGERWRLQRINFIVVD